MEKQYDSFCKLKQKDMSKAISDMTYQYINPETDSPTVVPASHYDSILNMVKEQFIDATIENKFLDIAYTQLKNLKQQDPKYFYQALLCLDLNLKPTDLRTNEQIALTLTYDEIKDKEENSKKNFNFLSRDVLDNFIKNRDNKQLHTEIISMNNEIDNDEIDMEY